MASLFPLVRHELRLVLRDGRFWWIGSIVVVLLLCSGLFGWSHADSLRTERQEAQQVAADQWRDQGEKNPHEAAHYGTWVFKPTGALSFVDPGVESSLGVSVKLQAHKRTALQGAAAQDSTAIKHFGQLSPASVLQLILPLLIIGLGFTAWSAERERGTMRQVLSYGVAPSRLLLGKFIGLALALSLVMGPAMAIGLVGVLLLDASGGAPVWRGALLVATYIAYGTFYLLTSLAVSATASSSRVALVVLLGFWGVTSLIVPRVAGALVDVVVPMPSAEAFAADVEKSMKEGLPESGGRDARVEELLGEMLKEQGFDGGLMMMAGSQLDGLELEAEARYEREVLDYHYARLAQRAAAQQTALQGVSYLSPFVAVTNLSMALAGTDLAHHRHFSASAEAHRRQLVSQLNRDFANKAGEAGWAYKANKALWDKAPDFDYTPPPLSWALRRQITCLVALGLWLLVAAVGAVVTARRVRAV